MPLIVADKGVKNTIKRIIAKEETKRFLQSLGFVVGSEVSIVNEINGCMIVNIKNSRVALNKDLAAKIII